MVCGLTESELPEPPGAGDGDGEGVGDGDGDGEGDVGALPPHCATASVNTPRATTVSRRCVPMRLAHSRVDSVVQPHARPCRRAKAAGNSNAPFKIQNAIPV